MAYWDRRPWSNWLGNVVVERPERHYYPTNLENLLDIVRDAQRHDPPRKVRACGSHWALSDVATSPNWFVETSGLRDSLTGVIPAALTAVAREDLARHPPGTGHGRSYYHVQGGVTLSELSERLDAGPGPRWAMPTLGGAAGQSLAGAIATGTHGGDHQLPPIADHVHAIHLVTSGARQLWIERTEGITDARLLARALPDVTQVRSTELFNTALVAMGRLGIVYALIIEVVEQFSLEQIIVESTWEEQEDQLRVPFPIFCQPRPSATDSTPTLTHFIEVVMPPYAGADGRHTCYITERWIGPDGPRPAPPRKSLFGVICSHATLRPVVLTLIGVDAGLLVLTAILASNAAVLIGVEGAVLIGLAALLPVSRRTTVGDLIAAGCNFANRHGHAGLVRWLGAKVIGQFRPRTRVQDVGYHVMDLGRTTGNCYRGDSVELAFDAVAGAHIAFVRDDLFPTLDRMAASGKALAGYISLRFTRRSAALLAMQRWDTTCSIEVALLKGVEGNAKAFTALQAAAVRHGGTVHWGQRNTLDRDAVARTFPDLARWRRAAGDLLGQDGEVFENEFCARHGLQPNG